MKKRISAIVPTATMFLVACGDGGNDTTSIINNGGNNTKAPAKESTLEGSITSADSSALLPLVRDVAKSFQDENQKVSISMSGGGSGAGLRQVSEGAIDIGNSDVYAEEKLDEAQAKDLIDHKVYVITVAPVVNKVVAEKVTDLTQDRIIGIFTGKITNWKEVDGSDEKIILISRPSASGARALFEEYALKSEKQIGGSLETDNSGTLLQTVTDTPGATGYLVLSYLQGENPDIKTVKMDGIEPTLENTHNEKHPVWGYKHMYIKGEPNEVAEAFLDYIMSDKYGQVVEKMGYGVTSKMQVEH